MISPLKFSVLAQQFGGDVCHDDVSFQSVSINTREIVAGDVFVALKGERFDAHDFIVDAQAKGAKALVVEKEVVDCSLPQWVVSDTTKALGHIAQAQRGHFKGQVVAITGSSGKTTVKGMLESILRAEVADDVFATKGNLNNHIGVPLSLLALREKHRYAVIEMGASAVGEIDYLTQMASPDVALINNVMSAHVEGFGSIDNIAKGKGEIYNGLSNDGVAIINKADKYSPQWLTQNSHRKTITFSAEEKILADVTASAIQSQKNGCAQFNLQLFSKVLPISLSVLGLHNVANALAAASCAEAMNISHQSIADGLKSFCGVAGRLQCLPAVNGSTVIDDSYNANPMAFCAAIDVLAAMTAATVLVMGDMGELGDESDAAHQQVGEYAATKNINHLLSIGEQSKKASLVFSGDKQHFNNIDQLIAIALEQANSNTVFLIKGSRSARMDRVVEALTSRGISSC
jgi:UDP-N-acetylmuramoyl-tripeptide--D-alanyl-D-alanine ligase